MMENTYKLVKPPTELYLRLNREIAEADVEILVFPVGGFRVLTCCKCKCWKKAGCVSN